MAQIGRTLRNARVERGLSIDQVAAETRISGRFLQALEDEAFDELPAPVYVRGFLRSYANFLRLDPDPLLAELAAGGGPPVAGPDGFVGGPREPARSMTRNDPFTPQRPDPFAPPRSDPFAPTRSAAPPPPAMPPAPPARRYEPDDAWGAGATIGGDDEGYEVEDEAPAYSGRVIDDTRYYAGRYAPEDRYQDDDTGEYDDDDDDVPPYVGVAAPAGGRFQPRDRGVLAERAAPGGDGLPRRVLAIAAIGVVGLLVFAVAVLALRGGGDDGGVDVEAAPDETATQAAGGGSTVTVDGSPSPGTPATASPRASASPSRTATGTPTPTEEATATLSPTPTNTAEATATPTEAPATPTPTSPPPTPTPTEPLPPQALPSGFSECQDLGSCGTPPWRVVCSPEGAWAIDVGRDFDLPAGWYEGTLANTENEAQRACL